MSDDLEECRSVCAGWCCRDKLALVSVLNEEVDWGSKAHLYALEDRS